MVIVPYVMQSIQGGASGGATPQPVPIDPVDPADAVDLSSMRASVSSFSIVQTMGVKQSGSIYYYMANSSLTVVFSDVVVIDSSVVSAFRWTWSADVTYYVSSSSSPTKTVYASVTSSVLPFGTIDAKTIECTPSLYASASQYNITNAELTSLVLDVIDSEGTVVNSHVIL